MIVGMNALSLGDPHEWCWNKRRSFCSNLRQATDLKDSYLRQGRDAREKQEPALETASAGSCPV